MRKGFFWGDPPAICPPKGRIHLHIIEISEANLLWRKRLTNFQSLPFKNRAFPGKIASLIRNQEAPKRLTSALRVVLGGSQRKSQEVLPIYKMP